jgi:hypothetical protein
MHFWKTNITKEESRDTGMAMVLLLLVLYLFQKREGLVAAAIALHVLNMTVPQIFRPAAVVWLGLSHVLGTVMSKILLAIVFFLIVTPMGVIRKITGKDSLKLRDFRASEESVMWERNYTFTAIDLEKPY